MPLGLILVHCMKGLPGTVYSHPRHKAMTSFPGRSASA